MSDVSDPDGTCGRHRASAAQRIARSGPAELLKKYEPQAHLILTIFWTIAIIPTLVWWKDSVLWVALMSLWANIASHLAAYTAAKAGKAIQENADSSP